MFTHWCEANGILIDYIVPGKPNQNAFIERFNRSYREEVLDDLALSALDLIDVNVKLRRQLRQSFITFESCQCHFRFEGG